MQAANLKKHRLAVMTALKETVNDHLISKALQPARSTLFNKVYSDFANPVHWIADGITRKLLEEL